MQIRQEQVDALSKRSAAEFVPRLAAFLRKHFPNAREEPIHRLQSEVEQQVRRARFHGMETEKQIANYVTAAWILGPDFDREIARVQRVLGNPIFTAQNKSEWLIRKACRPREQPARSRPLNNADSRTA